MQRTTSTTANNPTPEPVIIFSIRARNPRTLTLSATHVTATLDETQNVLCERIAQIAGLPLNRVRATFENSRRALDKRFHADSPPKVRDIANEGTVLVIKDLGIRTFNCANK
jgi:hypothetical protein